MERALLAIAGVVLGIILACVGLAAVHIGIDHDEAIMRDQLVQSGYDANSFQIEVSGISSRRTTATGNVTYSAGPPCAVVLQVGGNGIPTVQRIGDKDVDPAFTATVDQLQRYLTANGC